MSDNGASQEGGPLGMVDYSRYFNGRPETLDESLARIGEIGTPDGFNNYPWGWAQVGNTPGKRYKQNTHGGGIRDPLIAHWPAGITDKGGVRHQFHHVTDIAPTIFEAVGAARPDSVNGHAQMPVHGTSLFYAFAPEAASAPTRKQVQYFEMFGHRGIWADGWKAVTYHEPNTSWDADEWELYHLDSDFSECRNLAEKNPEKLRELIERWWAEAGRNGVLPLDDRRAELWRPTTGWSDPRNRTRYVFRPPFEEIRMSTAPSLGNRTFLATADIVRDRAEDEGCIFAFGDHRSGFTLYIQRGKLIFDYNLFGEHLKATSDRPLPVGKVSVGVAVERLGRVGRAQRGDRRQRLRQRRHSVPGPPPLGRQPQYRLRRRHRRQRRLFRAVCVPGAYRRARDRAAGAEIARCEADSKGRCRDRGGKAVTTALLPEWQCPR